MKQAPGRRVHRTGHLSLQGNRWLFSVWIRYGNRRNKRRCIGVPLVAAEHGGRRHLHDNTQIHDGNTFTHVIDDTQIMGNDQTGKIK